jgi:hypothetical protein
MKTEKQIRKYAKGLAQMHFFGHVRQTTLDFDFAAYQEMTNEEYKKQHYSDDVWVKLKASMEKGKTEFERKVMQLHTEQVEEQCDLLAEAIERAMLWASCSSV